MKIIIVGASGRIGEKTIKHYPTIMKSPASAPIVVMSNVTTRTFR